jgi:hypothetical protein
MPEFYRDHILLNQNTTTLPYTSLVQGRSKVKPRTNLDRVEQGTQVRQELVTAVNDFVENAPSDDFVYVVFKSAPGFLLDLAKFDARNYRLAFLVMRFMKQRYI